MGTTALSSMKGKMAGPCKSRRTGATARPCGATRLVAKCGLSVRPGAKASNVGSKHSMTDIGAPCLPAASAWIAACLRLGEDKKPARAIIC
eukprot:scaffold50375_cov59-Phaeocystis_antarctica.AAC.4